MSGVSYDDALAAITARLGKKAAKHCRRVSDSATALALVYDVDPDRARLAGLLHDWDREQTPEELLAVAERATQSASKAGGGRVVAEMASTEPGATD